MTQRYPHDRGQKVEQNTARSCGSRTFVRAIPAVREAAKDLWPKPLKPEVELQARSGIGPRSAEYVMSKSGNKGLSVDGLANLLVTDAGPRIFREFVPHIDRDTLAAYRAEIDAAELHLDQLALERRAAALRAGRGGAR